MAVEAAVARAPYASAPGRSRGRLYPEPVSPTRNAFRRDCDRVIHATAFRRLAYKTQVVDGGASSPAVRLNQPLQAECDHFLDCIEHGRRPQSDGLSGLRVVLAAEAAAASMRSGSAVMAIERVE